MKKHIAIINPASGNYFRRKKTRHWIKKLQSTLDVDIFYTKYAGHAGELAKEAYNKGCRSFLIFGGDGSIFDVINGLYPQALQDPPKIGLFPAGTGNSMMRDFSSGLENSFNAVLQERFVPCDVIKLQTSDKELFFTNLTSIGFVAHVADIRNKYFAWMGDLGYVLAVLSTLPFLKTKNYPIITDEKTVAKDWTYLSFNNSRYTGGNMMMAPHASVSDGNIALVAVSKISKWQLLQSFPKIYKGTHIHVDAVEVSHAKHIRLPQCKKQPVMIDGELLHLTPQSLSVHTQALFVYSL